MEVEVKAQIGYMLLGSLVPFLLGLVAFFFKRVITRMDKVIETTSDNAKELCLVFNKISTIEKAATDILVLKEDNRALNDKVTILDRNLKTAFKKIDELGTDLSHTRELLHATSSTQDAHVSKVRFLVEKITVLRSKLEKERIANFGDDPWVPPEK